MDFVQAINTINSLLLEKHPLYFNSSWIKDNSPNCYSFIQKNIRTHTGTIDWDKVTYALEWKFQRLWSPGSQAKSNKKYRDGAEVRLILRRSRKKQEEAGRSFMFLSLLKI
jgi:hypothetical protein